MSTVYSLDTFNAANWTIVELVMPLKLYRKFIACTYIGCCVIGFLLNVWVLFVISPIIHATQVRVPRSILFYILTLCVADLMTMAGMVFLNVEIVLGTWRFSGMACTAYLLFDGMNKFVAPIILFMISRTCYATICLDRKHQERAASLKVAIIRVLYSLFFILVILWPVFVYSQVYYVVRVNETSHTVLYVRKCSFVPPSAVELPFNVVVSLCSYAIPIVGFVYWYSRVPYFLWKRNEASSLNSVSAFSVNSANSRRSLAHVIRRVITIVVVLAVVYLVCWTPYWLGLYAHYFFQIPMTKNKVIIMYFVHLFPYVSCAIYPAIFTLFNRPIQLAHNEWRNNQRRRLQNYTEKRLNDVVSKTSKTASVASTKLINLANKATWHERRRANTYDKDTGSLGGDAALPKHWRRRASSQTISNSTYPLSQQQRNGAVVFANGSAVQSAGHGHGAKHFGVVSGKCSSLLLRPMLHHPLASASSGNRESSGQSIDGLRLTNRRGSDSFDGTNKQKKWGDNLLNRERGVRRGSGSSLLKSRDESMVVTEEDESMVDEMCGGAEHRNDGKNPI